MKKIPLALAVLFLAEVAAYAAESAPPATAVITIKTDSATQETVTTHPPEPEATLDNFVTKFRAELKDLAAENPAIKETALYRLLTDTFPRMELACTLARYQAAHDGPMAIATKRASIHCAVATEQVSLTLGKLLGSDPKDEDRAIFAAAGAPCIEDERPGCVSLKEPRLPSYEYEGFKIRMENATGYFGEPSCDYQGRCRGR